MKEVEYLLEILNLCVNSESYTRQILMGVDIPSFQMSDEIIEKTGIELVYVLKGRKDSDSDNLYFFNTLKIYGNTDLINFYYHILNSSYAYDVFNKEEVHIQSVGKQMLEINSLSALFTSYGINIKVDKSVLLYITDLYKHSSWKDLGNSLDEDAYYFLNDFLDKSNIHLDCLETNIYGLEGLFDILKAINNKKSMKTNIKSYNLILTHFFLSHYSIGDDEPLLIDNLKSLDISKCKFYIFKSNVKKKIDSYKLSSLQNLLNITVLDIDINESNYEEYSIIENKKY